MREIGIAPRPKQFAAVDGILHAVTAQHATFLQSSREPTLDAFCEKARPRQPAQAAGNVFPLYLDLVAASLLRSEAYAAHSEAICRYTISV